MKNTLIDYLGNREEDLARSERVSGVVTALVTNSKDPDKLGRVKLNFPWLAENSESDWVRVASFMAGKERGAFFIPEVDDEVLVAFEHGNVDAPIVIGALWSSEDKPPEQNEDGKNNVKLFKSRCGHTITLDDNSEGKKAMVEIKTNSGHIVKLDDASGKEKIEVIDKTGNNKVTIDSAKNTIDIESADKLNITAKQITITGNTSVTINGSTFKADISGTTEITGKTVMIN